MQYWVNRPFSESAWWSVLGVKDGFEGIFNIQTVNLTPELVFGRHIEAGSLLASNKSKVDGREKEFLDNFNKLGIDGIVTCRRWWNLSMASAESVLT